MYSERGGDSVVSLFHLLACVNFLWLKKNSEIPTNHFTERERETGRGRVGGEYIRLLNCRQSYKKKDSVHYRKKKTGNTFKFTSKNLFEMEHQTAFFRSLFFFIHAQNKCKFIVVCRIFYCLNLQKLQSNTTEPIWWRQFLNVFWT